jgi:dipeptidyl aminopeptidase/acylaminoacyl peptidase
MDSIWGSLRGLFVSDAQAKVPFSERLQVSPDGRRLYTIGTRQDHDLARADGVWVIDTSTWQIEQHWLAGSEPWAVLLSTDGRYLIVQDPPGQRSGVLHVFDTASGVETPVATPLDNGVLFSVPDLYAERYGHAPPGP